MSMKHDNRTGLAAELTELLETATKFEEITGFVDEQMYTDIAVLVRVNAPMILEAINREIVFTDDMVVAAMEKIPGCDHDAMVDALQAALAVAGVRIQ